MKKDKTNNQHEFSNTARKVLGYLIIVNLDLTRGVCIICYLNIKDERLTSYSV